MKVIIGVGIFLFMIVGYEGYRVYRAIQAARPIIASAVAYEQQGDGRRFLFAGESTGVGTGAERREESVAGRLGMALSNAHIDNVSENGAKISDALLQLESLPKDTQYDSVILMIGGNDILNFTDPELVRVSIQKLMLAAKARAGYVYLMTTGDLKTAPAFGPVLKSLYSLRSKKLRKTFMEEAARAGVIYVDLFDTPGNDPFTAFPEKHHARDGVHPSSEGYAVWYGKLTEAMK